MRSDVFDARMVNLLEACSRREGDPIAKLVSKMARPVGSCFCDRIPS